MIPALEPSALLSSAQVDTRRMLAIKTQNPPPSTRYPIIRQYAQLLLEYLRNTGMALQETCRTSGCELGNPCPILRASQHQNHLHVQDKVSQDAIRYGQKKAPKSSRGGLLAMSKLVRTMHHFNLVRRRSWAPPRGEKTRGSVNGLQVANGSDA